MYIHYWNTLQSWKLDLGNTIVNIESNFPAFFTESTQKHWYFLQVILYSDMLSSSCSSIRSTFNIFIKLMKENIFDNELKLLTYWKKKRKMIPFAFSDALVEGFIQFWGLFTVDFVSWYDWWWASLFLSEFLLLSIVVPLVLWTMRVPTKNVTVNSVSSKIKCRSSFSNQPFFDWRPEDSSVLFDVTIDLEKLFASYLAACICVGRDLLE